MSRISSSSSPSTSTGTSSTLVSPPRASRLAASSKSTRAAAKAVTEPCPDNCRGTLCACALGSPSGSGSGSSGGEATAARRSSASASSEEQRAPRRRVRAVVTPFGVARHSMDSSARPAAQPRLFARASSGPRPFSSGAPTSASDSSDSDAAPPQRSNGTPHPPPSSSPPLSSSSSGARSAGGSRRSIADVFERLMADEAARRTPARPVQPTAHVVTPATQPSAHVATPAPASALLYEPQRSEQPRTARRDDAQRLHSLARSTPQAQSLAQTPRARIAGASVGVQEQVEEQTPKGAADYAARLKALRRGRSESPRSAEGATPKAEVRREDLRASRAEKENVGAVGTPNGRDAEADDEADVSPAQEPGSTNEAEAEAESDFEAEMERERVAMEAQQAARPASVSPRRQRTGLTGKRLSSTTTVSNSFISNGDATPRAPARASEAVLSPAFAFPAQRPASPLPPSSPLFAHWSGNAGHANGTSFAHGNGSGANGGGSSESNSGASSPRRGAHRRSNPNSPTLSVSARAPSSEAMERLNRALGTTGTPEPEAGRQGEEREEEQTEVSSESTRERRTVRFSPTPSYRESSPVREEHKEDWGAVLEEEEEPEEEEEELRELPSEAQQRDSSSDALAPSSSDTPPPPLRLSASSPARPVSRHIFMPSTPSRPAPSPRSTAARSTSPPLALGARSANLSLFGSPGTPHPPGFFGVGAASASPSVRRLGGSSLRPQRSRDSLIDATHEDSISAELAPLQEASDDEIVTMAGPPRQSTPPLTRASATQKQAATAATSAHEAADEKDPSLHATLEQLLRVLSQRPVSVSPSTQPLPELQLDASALLATTERLAQLRRDETDAERRRAETREKDEEESKALSTTRAKLGALAEAVRTTREHVDSGVIVPLSYAFSIPPSRNSRLRTALFILGHSLFLLLVLYLAEAGASHRFHTTYYDPFYPPLFPPSHDSNVLSGAEALLEALPARSKLGALAAAALQPLLRLLSRPPEQPPSFIS